MDDKRFSEALQRALSTEKNKNEIGTLSERTVHLALKYYFEPDTDCHEIPVGDKVADICSGDEIIEIQTRAFFRLRQKLELFLPEFRVTVVYPVASKKYISWISPETGEVTKERLSPKRGSPSDILPELYSLRDMIGDPHLRFCIAMIERRDRRLQSGRSDGGKKHGAVTLGSLPTDLVGLIYINDKKELKKLIPPTLGEYFTMREFQKASHLSGKRAWYALKTLVDTGAVTESGTEGRAKIYKI